MRKNNMRGLLVDYIDCLSRCLSRMTPIKRGSIARFVGRPYFVKFFGDFLNSILYAHRPREPDELTADRTYTANKTFWEDALEGIHFEEMRISLHNFHLMEWMPSAPGRYFTPGAIASRRKAQEYIAPDGSEYLPIGKEQMILGGIGSIRLGVKEVDFRPTYFLGASSTGITHEGIPVAMNKSQYLSVIKTIKEHGGCVVNLVGSLRLLPASMSVIDFVREIPRYYFFTEEVEPVEPSSENELLASIAIMFSSELSEKTNFAKDGYTTNLRKMWSFCSFNPRIKHSLESAVNWLKDYVARYSRIVNPPILNDFDEHYQHFENPVEFSLRQLFNNKIDRKRLIAYKKHYKFNVNIENVNIGKIVMGDIFENIRDSTIVNRSIVEKSFNKVREEIDQDTAMALLRVAEEIAKSGNPEAAELFEGFNEELQKPEPRGSVLKSIWDGIEKALPTIVQLTDVVTRISKLFGI